MKRSITAILAGGAVFGATVAFAATLGVDGNNLGSGASPDIAACDTVDGVDTDYTVVFDTVDEVFEVTEVTVYNVDAACDGEYVQVAIFDGTDWSTSDDNHLVSGTDPLTFAIDGVVAEDVVNVAVTIYDGDGADDA